MLTSSTKVLFYRYRKDFGGVQRLVRVWRLFGMKVWTTVIDEEEVPAWADIESGALGSTNWRSKFYDYI